LKKKVNMDGEVGGGGVRIVVAKGGGGRREYRV